MIDPDAKLERMANEIALFFRAYPHEEAVAGVREHIGAFWAPVMRRALVARLNAGQGDIHPIVQEALRSLGAGKSPAARETAGPDTAGEIGASDAG